MSRVFGSELVIQWSSWRLKRNQGLGKCFERDMMEFKD